ncbi:spore germination protein [Paenibacillus antri]|uniref:Spore germination protein n=2 Tax=Paenibacillus antri TaxID=2582848 RepID=A0A5R9G489_9BACL|nr:spore germination protein [Paenibacillus antri]
MYPAVDVSFRNVADADGADGLLVYLQGAADENRLEEQLIEALRAAAFEDVALRALSGKKVDSFENALNEAYLGKVVLFVAGRPIAYAFGLPSRLARGIKEPATEAVIRGPREGFIERIDANLALLRNKIRTPKLKFEQFLIGSESQTRVVLGYHAELARKTVLREARKRLEAIDLDVVLESGYIGEMITDRPRSLFPQLMYTERPDIVAAQLMEGRFAILIDGTPFVLTAPVTFWQMLHSAEDYYEKFTFASFVMHLRYWLLFLALFLPGIYVATITFHHDLLPTSLLLSIAAARESIPFPALIEALIMELSFEALREAGVRLPKTIGQAVSILGALVIGQAAVQAGIVSAPMVIVVSMTGIASFTIPRYNFGIAIRLLRFPLMILAGMFGLYGMVVGTILIAVHLCNLTSFGVPYMTGVAPLRRSELKDIVVRVPWYLMKRRPSVAAKEKRRRS